MKIDNIEQKIKQLTDSISRDEVVSSAKYLSALDKKVAQSLSQKGNKTLANSIIKNSNKNIKKLGIKKRKTFLFDVALYTSGISMVMVSFIVAYAFIQTYLGTTQKPEDTISFTQQLAQASLVPSDLTKSGYVSTESELVIQIPGEVNENLKENITLEPAVEFEVVSKVVDNQTIVTIIPSQELTKGEKYALTIDTENNLSPSQNSVTWLIDIDPELTVKEISPTDGQFAVPIDSTISLEFSSENIDIEKLEKLFSVSPQIEGDFYLENGRFVYYSQSALEPNITYTVTLDIGEYGVNGEELSQMYTSSFTTAYVDSLGNSVNDSKFYFVEGSKAETTYGGISSTIFAKGEQEVEFNLYLLNYAEAIRFVEGSLYDVPESNEVYSSIVKGSSQIENNSAESNNFIFGYDTQLPGYYLLEAKVGGGGNGSNSGNNNESEKSIYKFFTVSNYCIVEYNENVFVYDILQNDLLDVDEFVVEYNETNNYWIATVLSTGEKLILQMQDGNEVNLSWKSAEIGSEKNSLTGKSSEYQAVVELEKTFVLSGEENTIQILLTDLLGQQVANKNLNITLSATDNGEVSRGVSKYVSNSNSMATTTSQDGVAKIDFGPLENGSYDVFIKIEGDGIIDFKNAFEIGNYYIAFPESLMKEDIRSYLYLNDQREVVILSNSEVSGMIVSQKGEDLYFDLFNIVGKQKLYPTELSVEEFGENPFCVIIFDETATYQCL